MNSGMNYNELQKMKKLCDEFVSAREKAETRFRKAAKKYPIIRCKIIIPADFTVFKGSEN